MRAPPGSRASDCRSCGQASTRDHARRETAANQVPAPAVVRQSGVVLPSLRPGISRDNLLQSFRDRHRELVNLRGGGGPGRAQDRIRSYLEWVTNAARNLTYQVSAADLDQLVLTHGYDRLLAASTMPGTDVGTQRVLNGMLSLELDQRVNAFAATIAAVQNQIARWHGEGVFTVPDTSFYIEHYDKLQDADFRPILKIRHEPVHILVPIAVVDELDGLKKSKDTHTRWRAGLTLAVLDRAISSPPDAGSCGPWTPRRSTPAAGSWPGHHRDPLRPAGHVRLLMSDVEIISRIVAIEPWPAPGHARHLDTGQATRGRAAGLQVRKLDKPEPDPESPTAGGPNGPKPAGNAAASG